MTTDPLRLFAQAASLADSVIAAVRPDQLDLPTPCTGWDVRAVIDHMITGNRNFTDRFAGASARGSEPVGPGVPPVGRDATPVGRDATPVGRDATPAAGDPRSGPLPAFRDSIRDLAEAASAEGVLGTLYQSPLGEVPGTVLMLMRGSELVIHSWDVARATGQPTDFAPGLVAASRGFFERVPVPRGGAAPFQPEQPAPEGATDADRLAAFLGRSV